MDDILITKGDPLSNVGSKLNCMALEYMAYPLAGSKEPTLIEKVFKKLWEIDSNRFSYEYAFEAKLNDKTVGMITCFPVTVMNKLNWLTTKKLFKLRNLGLIRYILLHPKETLSMLSLNEGKEDEYHIGSIATLPESRGYGIGSKLIYFAEEQAKLNHYNKCSLTVKKENKKAIKLYEKLGFKIVDSIEKPPYSLHRMVKIIDIGTIF
ncbi:GNAT family N-acetyltransferase [Clostridium sp. HBUAS56017]|uniref:GNAT family N-acetyltransferase n=1 Tax=Clostridium sp. HBUAS56017 TaxID=2571128 RepID=UPI001178AF25|nr:GNAT family N-acetyltransferase [Clostridium sp. HBUAS56017]